VVMKSLRHLKAITYPTSPRAILLTSILMYIKSLISLISVTKGIPPNFAVAHSCPNLSSEHSPVLVTLTSKPIRPDPPQSLSNKLQIGITSNTSSTNDCFCKFLLRQQTTYKKRSSSSQIQFNGLVGRRHLHPLLELESMPVL
jgi:hypothetical protein